MPNQFEPRCPSCLRNNHVAYRLFIGAMDLGTPYGDSFRHCEACGLKFSLTSSVELIELPPTTEWHERHVIEITGYKGAS